MELFNAMSVARNELENVADRLQAELGLSDFAMAHVIAEVEATMYKKHVTREGYAMAETNVATPKEPKIEVEERPAVREDGTVVTHKTKRIHFCDTEGAGS